MPSNGGERGRRDRKVRVELRANRGKVRRDKQTWTRGFREDRITTQDAAQVESVRAKGELSRKRTVVIPAEAGGSAAGCKKGVVTAVRGLVVQVDDGESIWACTVRRAFRTRRIKERQRIATGDRVLFRPGSGSGDPQGAIEQVEPRRTILTRAYEDRVHVIAANVDQALVVSSADDPPLRPHLIDRFLVATHQGGLKPIVCINKMDLDATGAAQGVLARYRNIGYTTLAVSVVRDEGIGAVREALRGQTTVIVGMSGVGKSSLLNVVQPGLKLRVADLGETSRRGRHTTSTAELIRLSIGGYVVDTPGIRQFDLADVAASDIEAYFIEFVERVKSCRFADCTHVHEEDCAIRAAVERGEIHPERYDSYVRMVCERKDKKSYE